MTDEQIPRPRMPLLLRPFDKVIDGSVRRSLEREQTFVKRPDRARRLFLREIAISVVVLGAMFARLWMGWVETVAMMIIGVFVGFSLLGGLKRAGAYRNGWLNGRASMVQALAEAHRRDMSLDDWLNGELARDLPIMGASPYEFFPERPNQDDEP